MFYSKEEKELLGRYFKYYREKQGIKLNEVLSLGICDYKTYKGIEEGKARPNNDFYDRFAGYYRIDTSVLTILRDLKPYYEELYDACEWYDKERIINTSHQIQKKIDRFSNQLIICELLETLNYIKREYILNEYLNELEIFHSLKLITLWENSLSSILIEVSGKSNTNSVLSIEIFKLMKPLANRDDTICKYWYAKLCVTDVNYIEATHIFDELLKKYEHSRNTIRKTRVLMSLFNIYRDVDYKKAIELSITMEKTTEKKDLPNNLKEAIFYNLGMYFYLHGNYKKALYYYENANNITEDMMTTLFICACRSRLNEIEGYRFNIDNNHVYSDYLNYFKFKSMKTSNSELEKFIVDNLLEILKKEKYEQPFWNMFDYEMSELVKLTRNYKKYHNFKENFQKATKTAL